MMQSDHDPRNDVQNVLEMLNVLNPLADDAPLPTPQALARLKQRLEPARPHPVWRFLSRLLPSPGRRLATAVAALVLLFSLSLSFPAVRAAASDLLGFFRVQKFAAISISPEQIAILEQIADAGLTPGELEMIVEPGQPTAVGSLAEAGEAAGLTARTFITLGAPHTIEIAQGGNGRLRIDLAGARGILQAAGGDPTLLPDSLDGALIDIRSYPVVSQLWAANNLQLLQTASPNITYPDGLDATLIGEAVLRVLGLNDKEAQKLAREIDWTGTLLLPIPQDAATFNEVNVDGTTGIAVNSLSGHENVVMWQNNGFIYILSGEYSSRELVTLANTLP